MTRRALFLTVAFLLFWGWLTVAARPAAVPAHEPLSGVPLDIDGWQGRAGPPLDSRILAVLGADDYITRIYRNADGAAVLSLYAGYYNSQKQGDSIHSPMNCLPGAGWLPVRSERIQITDPRTPDGLVTINKVLVRKADEQQLALYWYQSQGRVVASEYMSKAYLFLDALRTSRSDAALVRIMSPVTAAGEPAAEDGARRFASALLPVLERYLPN
jgi:EpsI family protein